MTHDFQGKWITEKTFADLTPVNVFHRQLDKKEILSTAPQNAHILFRRRFTAGSGQAQLYISADDYYKLYINGRFVCQGPAPGYPFHYYYNKVDVTEYLTEGENLIAVHTYYQGLINRVWVSGDDRHGLILDLEQNGRVILTSDETFLCAWHTGFEAIGKAGYDTQFLERYTSGSPQEQFEQPGFDDSCWQQAALRSVTDYQLFEQPSRMLTFEKILPVSAIWDETGVTLDFGAVYVGYLQARAQTKGYDFGTDSSCEGCETAAGMPGVREVELLFGQELWEDGSVRWQLRCNCDYREEWRICGGVSLLNQFDYKSFRYVRMNIPAGVTVDEISLCARHYPFALRRDVLQKAELLGEDPELKPIWNLCVNTLRYGVQEVIQDCMEREKGNYLGDGCYTALTHYALTGDPSVLKKLMDDSLRSSFINDGLMTCAACSFMQEIAEYPFMAYHMLYRYYELSGDRAYLEQHYDALCRILDFYKEQYGMENGLLCNLDKWCVVEWPAPYRDGYTANIEEGKVCTDLHSVINAHYIGAMQYMNKIARICGYPPYCDVEPVKKAFFAVFYDPEKKLFRDMAGDDHISLISNVFPLMYGIFPEQETAAGAAAENAMAGVGAENAAEKAILDLIEERGFTRVMLFGAYPILEGLRQRGRTDLIRKYLTDEGAWKRMLTEGATTTFEGWGKDAKWNTSLFHLTLSYGALFMLYL